MIDVALFGAGRIGTIHAGNVARQPGARLKYVVDVDDRSHVQSRRCQRSTVGAQHVRVVTHLDGEQTPMAIPGA